MRPRGKTPPPRPGKLFTEPERPADAQLVSIDGASRGNPGPAAYAVVVHGRAGGMPKGIQKYIGRATNNEAEYYALIAALDYAASHRITKLRVHSDSELLVMQMKGAYRVKNARLRPLHERAGKLTRALEFFSIEHVPREQNREADRLANEALDRPEGRGVRGRDLGANEPPATRQSPLVTHKIRARYERGVLRPARPLDLAEGEEVEVTVHRRNQG